MEIICGLASEDVFEVAKEIWELEIESWDEPMAASFQTILERLKKFNQGLWRLYEHNELLAYMFFIRLKEQDFSKNYSWNDFTSEGTCSNHKEDGEILFGVSIGSKSHGKGNHLFDVGIDNMSKGYYKGTHRICACSRIPTLSRYFSEPDAVTLDLTDRRLLEDPVVKMLYKKGFSPFKLCEEGFAVDEESLGYSLTMIKNITGIS